MKPFRSAISSLDLYQHLKVLLVFLWWTVALCQRSSLSSQPIATSQSTSAPGKSRTVPYFSLLTPGVFFGAGPLACLSVPNTETAGNYTMFSKFSSLTSWLTQLKTLARILRGRQVACWCPISLQFCHSSTVQSQSSTSFSVPQQWRTAWAKPKFSAPSLDFRGKWLQVLKSLLLRVSWLLEQLHTFSTIIFIFYPVLILGRTLYMQK